METDNISWSTWLATPIGSLVCTSIWIFLMGIVDYWNGLLTTWNVPYSIILTFLFVVVFLTFRLTSKINAMGQLPFVKAEKA